jgi:hypothetical protein
MLFTLSMNGKLMLTLQGTPWSYQCKLKQLEMRYFLDGLNSTGGEQLHPCHWNLCVQGHISLGQK